MATVYAKYFWFLWSETKFIYDLTHIGTEYKTIKPFYESQRIYWYDFYWKQSAVVFECIIVDKEKKELLLIYNM